MKLKFPHKLLILCLSITIMALLCFYYASNYEKHLQNPSYGAILSDYPLGQVVHVDGSVIMIYPDSYDLIQNYHGQTIIMKVLGPSPAHLRDQVSILGVLGPSNQIVKVKKIHVLSWWKWEFELKRSFLVIPFLLILFLYFWKFNLRKFEFRRR
jgi:hypothetical protein